ncbi:MAG: biotin--[acetyl-CoA-carboxylase] ligase [Alphaproteobacteria bacterium]|nr:biotin--[acetyl-CoA-carboxylase] ligase [Alphaproteobacteria bacterium]NCQ66692.1 biotin--[acetyl-CoA-carboxylase] ligase [Alphaproteobacteria bacterium]NCT07143.1 biotin--[acetyl-CoA-carboxylase] ligase [Alphaproteobacteria bacterium]
MIWKIRRFDSVSSTMDVAKELLGRESSERYVVFAKQQEKGRGRQQRFWSSPLGNFYATFVISVDDLSNAPLFSYVTALALYGAVEQLTKSYPSLTLKWPNDLLLDSKKIGGILLEVEATSKGLKLLIGVGVNLKSHPVDTPYGATDLSVYDFDIKPEDLLKKLCVSFDHWRRTLEDEGFSPLRKEWLRRRDPAHDRLTLKGYEHGAENSIKGCFYDLDEKGYLVLTCKEEGQEVLRKFSAGDVFFS